MVKRTKLNSKKSVKWDTLVLSKEELDFRDMCGVRGVGSRV